MKLHDVEQGTEEWKELRGQYFTASTLGDWLIEEPENRMTKKEINAFLAEQGLQQIADKEKLEVFQAAIPEDFREGLKTYTEQRNKAWKNAIFTRLGKVSQDEEPEWDTWATKRGKKLEPEARDAYAKEYGVAVQQVGFISHECEEIGCSPDGLVCGDVPLSFADLEVVARLGRFTNGLQLKCHRAAIHGRFLDEGGFRDEHALQCHAEMAATGIREWHLYGYHPELPPLKEVFKWDKMTDLVLSRLMLLVADYEATWLRIKSKHQKCSKAQTPNPAAA